MAKKVTSKAVYGSDDNSIWSEELAPRESGKAGRTNSKLSRSSCIVCLFFNLM
jgi:hypothetical protein